MIAAETFKPRPKRPPRDHKAAHASIQEFWRDYFTRYPKRGNIPELNRMRSVHQREQ